MVIRYATPWGLERDASGSFDQLVSEGWRRKHAAWGALYDWDLLERPEGADAAI